MVFKNNILQMLSVIFAPTLVLFIDPFKAMTSHIGNQPLQTIQFVFIRFINLFHDDHALRGAKLLTVRSEVIQYLRFLKLHKRTGVSIRYFARGCRIRDYDLT